MQQATAPPEPLLGVDPSAPLVRPLPFPVREGTLWTAMLDENGQPVADEFQAVWLRVSARGHSWMSSQSSSGTLGIVCRGCQLPVFDGMDSVRCSHPAAHQDVATALLASWPRPKPVAPRALYAEVAAL